MSKINTYFSRKKIIELFYMLTMSIAFTTRLGSTEINYIISVVIAFLWVAIAMIIFFKNYLKNRINIIAFFKNNFDIPLLFLLPSILIYIYTIILLLFGKLGLNNLSTNITAYTPALAVISSTYLFKNKTFNLTIKALIISFLIVFAYNMYFYGFEILKQTFLNIIFGIDMTLTNAFEVHDLTFAAGIIVLLYILNKPLKENNYILFVFLFIVFIGWKRIQILALLAIILLYFLSKKLVITKKHIIVISIFTLTILLFYIYLIDSGTLTKLVNALNINSMGRIYYYDTIAKFFNFDIFETGLGRNMVTQILTSSQYSYLKVAGVHSDILKYFAETGFIVFSGWILYYFYVMPSYILKKYGHKIVKQFYLLTIYMFILYLTDNVDIYFCTQFTYILTIFFLTRSSKLKEVNLCEK